MLIFQVLYATLTLVDINPQGPIKLDINRDGYVAESFRPILEKYGYTDRNGFSESKALNRDIKKEKDEMHRLKLLLVKQLVELRIKVNEYDYSQKIHDIRESTAVMCAQVSVLLGKILSLRYSRPAICTAGSFRFPPNPAGFGPNYATTVSHVDSHPEMKKRFKDLALFVTEYFNTEVGKSQTNKNSENYDLLLHQKQEQMESYWKPLLGHSNSFYVDNFDMINFWMPMNDGNVENYPLAMHRRKVSTSDFSLIQRIITFNNPLVYVPDGDYEMCYWDQMKFGDYFLFKSLVVAHRALNLNNIVPGGNYKSNRKSMEMRCFLEKIER